VGDASTREGQVSGESGGGSVRTQRRGNTRRPQVPPNWEECRARRIWMSTRSPVRTGVMCGMVSPGNVAATTMKLSAAEVCMACMTTTTDVAKHASGRGKCPDLVPVVAFTTKPTSRKNQASISIFEALSFFGSTTPTRRGAGSGDRCRVASSSGFKTCPSSYADGSRRMSGFRRPLVASNGTSRPGSCSGKFWRGVICRAISVNS
jgi:hypothetical protein